MLGLWSQSVIKITAGTLFKSVSNANKKMDICYKIKLFPDHDGKFSDNYNTSYGVSYIDIGWRENVK